MIQIPMTLTMNTVSMPASIAVACNVVDADVYDGETTIIPGATEKVLLTANKMVLDNITIGAIPSNYGLITWTGRVLTVS